MAFDITAVTTVITTIGKAASDILSNDDVAKNVYGTYSDGTNRSLGDAIKGEYLSPKQKKKVDKKVNKVKKGKGTKFKL